VVGGLLAKAAGYVTFFTVLIAIAVLTLGGVAITENALSDHTKYGTVAFGDSTVLELPAGDVAVAYGTFVEDTHFDHIVVPPGIGVQILPVQSTAPRPVIQRDPADFYNDEISSTVNQAQRVWTVHVLRAGTYRVTPLGNVSGELLLGHDAAVAPDTIIIIGVIAAAIDAAAWFLTTQLRRRRRRAA
jgi:hypothetical protein